MVSTVGMLVGVLALVAGVLVLSFGITSLHTSIDDLHHHISANENWAQQQHKSTKDLSQLLNQDSQKLIALTKRVQKDEDTLTKNLLEVNKGVTALRGDVDNRMVELKKEEARKASQVADSAHEIEGLREALSEEKKRSQQSASKLAEMEEYMKNLMAQNSDSERTQHALEAAVKDLTATVASMGGKAAAKLPAAELGVMPKPRQAAAVEKDGEGSAVSAGALSSKSTEVVAEGSDVSAEGLKSDTKEGEDDAKDSANPKVEGESDTAKSGEKAAEDEKVGEVEGEAAEQGSDAASDTENAGDEKVGEVESEAALAKSTKMPAVLRGAAQATSKPGAFRYRVAWYRECGCTGMEVEAVTLLVALTARIGKERVSTNRCDEGCQWPEATQAVLRSIAVKEDRDLWPREPRLEPASGEAHILVVHAAFEGVCGVPDGLDLPPRGEEENAAGLFRVSRSMMETDRLSEVSANRCNDLFDQVWVPSEFNRLTFSEASVKKSNLHLLPEGCDTDLFKCKITETAEEGPPTKFGIERLDEFLDEGRKDSMTFTFLSVFKWEPRKNWRDLLDTFWRVFPTDKTTVKLESGHSINVTARLLIKTQQLSWGSDVREDVTAFLASKGMTWDQAKERLLIVTRSLPEEAMPVLYRAVDAFLLPSHGEGWGLPIAEAMSSGLPTIATSWGGQSAFMTKDNSWPLKYTLSSAEFDEMALDDSPQSADKWAIPDATDFQEALLEVVKRTPGSAARAEQACKDIRQNFSPDRIALAADELLSGLSRATTA